jgi:hypothetical protein
MSPRFSISHWRIAMKLKDKRILVVTGSLLAAEELHRKLAGHGARVFMSGNLVSVYELLRRHTFSAAVLDQSLHNEAYDLCTELEAFDVPYVWSREPERLADPATRQHQASHTVTRLVHAIGSMRGSRRDVGSKLEQADHLLEFR